MNNESITQAKKENKFNLIKQLIKEYRDEPEEKLIRVLFLDEGYSLYSIAKILGVSSEALRLRYPTLQKEKLALKEAHE